VDRIAAFARRHSMRDVPRLFMAPFIACEGAFSEV
jgi:hypothetical protein